jgi:hypothetical protein
MEGEPAVACAEACVNMERGSLLTDPAAAGRPCMQRGWDST